MVARLVLDVLGAKPGTRKHLTVNIRRARKGRGRTFSSRSISSATSDTLLVVVSVRPSASFPSHNLHFCFPFFKLLTQKYISHFLPTEFRDRFRPTDLSFSYKLSVVPPNGFLPSSALPSGSHTVMANCALRGQSETRIGKRNHSFHFLFPFNALYFV